MSYKYWAVLAVDKKGATGLSYHVAPLEMEKPIAWSDLEALSDAITQSLQSKYQFVVKVIPINIIPFKEDGTI